MPERTLSTAAKRPQKSPPRTLEAVRASSIEPVRIDWLAEDFIPRGKLGLITGDGGVGKNLYCTRVIADLTNGHLLDRPGNALVAEAEDAAGDVGVPRLIAAGADLDRVFFIEARNGRPFVTPHDVERARKMIEQHDIDVVLISPLTSHVSSRFDDSREGDMRDAVGPLADLAHETGATIAAIRHPNKRGEGSFRSRVTGSHGLFDLARWVLHVSPDPQNAGGDTRIVTAQKANLSRSGKALRFRIAERIVASIGPVPFVTDLEEANDVTTADVLDAPSNGAGHATKLKRAKGIILAALDDGEWHRAGDVSALCRGDDIGRATIERAATLSVYESVFTLAEEHDYRLPRSVLRRTAKAAGFTPERIEDALAKLGARVDGVDDHLAYLIPRATVKSCG